jgi:hypothetical protein
MYVFNGAKCFDFIILSICLFPAIITYQRLKNLCTCTYVIRVFSSRFNVTCFSQCQTTVMFCTCIFQTGRSRWPRCLRRGPAAACCLGLWGPIPPGALVSVSWECCVLSGRGLCVGLIAGPEESYWVWCVWLSVVVKRRYWGSPGPLRNVAPLGKQPITLAWRVFIFYLYWWRNVLYRL